MCCVPSHLVSVPKNSLVVCYPYHNMKTIPFLSQLACHHNGRFRDYCYSVLLTCALCHGQCIIIIIGSIRVSILENAVDMETYIYYQHAISMMPSHEGLTYVSRQVIYKFLDLESMPCLKILILKSIPVSSIFIAHPT